MTILESILAPNTEQEAWRPVAGWEGVYEVSSLGRFRRGGHTLTGSRQKNGYVKLTFRAGGRVEYEWAHRVVARAFLGPPPEGAQVDHRDFNPSNNAVTNLRYLTQQENIQHSFVNGRIRRGENHYGSVLTEDMVREIRRAHERGASGRQIAARLVLNRWTVLSVLQGKSWAHVK